MAVTLKCCLLAVAACRTPWCADWGTRWHSWRLSLGITLPMVLYALLPSRWTAWLALWTMMDEPWSQQDDPGVQHLLLIFRQVQALRGGVL